MALKKALFPVALLIVSQLKVFYWCFSLRSFLLRIWFEPRSNIPSLKKIIWMVGVLQSPRWFFSIKVSFLLAPILSFSFVPNGLFLSSPQSLFQSESESEIFVTVISCTFNMNETWCLEQRLLDSFWNRGWREFESGPLNKIYKDYGYFNKILFLNYMRF